MHPAFKHPAPVLVSAPLPTSPSLPTPLATALASSEAHATALAAAFPRATIAELLTLVPEPARLGCQRLLAAEAERWATAPGSRAAHQAWPGGYADHLRDGLNLVVVQVLVLQALRPLPFTLGDAILAFFLHDAEKPGKYVPRADDHAVGDVKADRHAWRLQIAAHYDIPLTPAVENAIRFAEGEGDAYRPGERVMGPLAAVVHTADILSARLWHDFPRAADDPWPPAVPPDGP